MTQEYPDLSTGRDTSGNRDYPGARAGDPALTDDQGYRLDDAGQVPPTGSQAEAVATFDSEGGGAGALRAEDPAPATLGSADAAGGSETAEPGAGSATGASDLVRRATEQAADEVSSLKDTAAEQSAHVKDAALQHGTDLADVAKDEFSRVAGDAREQFQALWEQAGSQLREQADAGRQQLADLLHSLAAELGEMAAKSEQDGPVTALAREAARRGGEVSHWLADSQSSDVLSEIRRFARRRPFVFLAGAAVAGIVVGRLSRGLMAGAETSGSPAATKAAEATDVPAPRLAAEVPGYGGGSSGQTYGYDVLGEGGEPR
jgi:hypothetical protein